MKNYDEAFDIYQSFLDLVNRDCDFFESVKLDKSSGREIIILKLCNGFRLELTNVKGAENSANLRCWWHSEENAVEIDTFEQLHQEFYRN